MRDIKFRAWSNNLAKPGSNEFMEYSDKVGIAKFFSIYPKAGVVLNGGAERFIMQFTGLKDKNGVEIYEGDILSFLGETWKVVYFETYASFMLEKGNDLLNITTQEEVIGNIYQHKELLDR